jgi:hypothetical protein
MEPLFRVTGMPMAIPNGATRDIRFGLTVENGEPLFCVANNIVVAQIAHDLGRVLRLLNTGLAFQGSPEAMPDPLSDQEALAGWRRNTVLLSLLTMSLQDFAAKIIRHVLRGGILDDAGFTEIKEAGVRYLKNLNAEGLSIDQEAESVGQTINNFQQLADSIIAQGRDLDQD